MPYRNKNRICHAATNRIGATRFIYLNAGGNNANQTSDALDRQRAFEAFERQTKTSGNPEKTVKETREATLARVEGAQKNALDYVRGLFQEGGTLQNADKNAINREVARIAKERLGAFEAQLENTKVEGVKRLHAIAEKADRSLVLAQMKAKVLEELTADFEAKRSQLRERKDAYVNLKEALQNRFTARYKLKKGNLMRSRLIAVKNDVTREITAMQNRQEVKQVEQWDTKLRGILVRGQPNIAAELDELLIENAAGNPAKLDARIQKMVDEKHLSKIEADTARSYAKALHAGLRRWYRWSGAGTKDIAGFYTNRIIGTHESQEGAEPDPKKRTNNRIQRLEKAKVGQWVTIRIGRDASAKEQEYYVSHRASDKIFLTGRSGETPAMITTKRDSTDAYRMTTRQNGASGAITEYNLDAPTDKLDPTRLTFGTEA